MKLTNLMNYTVTSKYFWKRQRRINLKTEAAIGGCLVVVLIKATLCRGEELNPTKASKTHKNLF